MMFFKKSLRLRRLKLDQDEIWLDCFSCKYDQLTESDFCVDIILSRCPLLHMQQLKSIHIWKSYGKKQRGPDFLVHGV